jgi:cytochrome P450
MDDARLMEEPLQFNPFLPEVHEDPYPLYRRLRSEDPVHRAFPGIWVLTRHADCVAVLRDHERFSNDFTTSQSYTMFVEQTSSIAPELVADRTRSLLAIDQPDHTRIRTLVNKAFTARAIEALRPHMVEVVDGLIDAMRGESTVDLVPALAYPLPVTIICEMLGVPEADRDQFHGWSADLVPTIDPMVPIPVLQRAVAAHEAFLAYLRELAADRRRDPGPDLVSALIAVEDGGRSLSEDELFTTCILLLVAGHETTVNLISNGMLTLLRHPDELARLRQDPSLIRSAVEELLRYDAPVQLDGRTVRAEVELGGRAIHPGEQVMTVLGAANRDPEVFAEPDLLDLAREDNRHIAFGGGIHFCLGATLARIEGQEAIGRLVTAFPRIELATDAPERRASITLRGLASLPVTIA